MARVIFPMNCILPCNLVFIYDITLYITAQVTDDTAFVHGLDLVEVDDCVLGEHRSIFLRFDNDFFYIIGEAVEAIIRGGRCNNHSVCKIIENNGWMRKGQLRLNIAAAKAYKDLIAPFIAVGFLFAFGR